MKNYQKIIYFCYTLLSIKLLISKNLFNIISILFISNYFLLRGKISQNRLNKITFFQIVCWLFNTIIVLTNDSSLWFLGLCNLMWLLTSIKIIEVKNLFHIKNAVLFILISVGLSSLFNQDIYSNAVHIICCFLSIYSLLIINNYQSSFLYKQLIILSSFVPITLLTFIYIPKVNPWLNLNSNFLTETGLSNKLKPGDISSLIQNEQLVGRIYFDNKIPLPRNRYWRVYVLDQFENNTWEEYEVNKLKVKNDLKTFKSITNNNKHSSEKWVLEPSYIKNIPWSGNGLPVYKNLNISSKGLLVLERPLKERLQYEIVTKNNSWRNNIPNEIDKKVFKSENKLLNALGQKWFKESNSKEEIILKAQEFFQENGFRYSANPGRMNKLNPYDDFLFNRKIGFCEHYASSFTLLMRAAKIPSRVVVGYQGGEILTNYQKRSYLLLDNSYAHAWSEVWLDDKGWTRIDPTEWIYPERIENSNIIIENRSNFNKLVRNFRVRIYNNFSSLEFGLNSILNKLNFKPVIFSKNLIFNRIITIVIFLLSLIITLGILLMSQNSKSKDIFKIIINIYLDLLERLNYKIKTGETLIIFSKRMSLSFPKISAQIFKISDLYNYYRFLSKKKYPQTILVFFSLVKSQIIILIYLLFNSKRQR